MSDDLKKRRPQDAGKINIHESWEVSWWCHELGVSRKKLETAVRRVGTSAKAVRKYLRRWEC